MERAVVVGNCQAKALEVTLGASRAFRDRFTLVTFPAVHEIPEGMIPELHRAVASATVVITQLVNEDYRDGIGLGTETLASLAADATVIRWPNVYWDGYFPDLCYLRDAEGTPILDGPGHYHDRVVLTAFRDGSSPDDVCSLLADPDTPSDAASRAAKATAELGQREERCDVLVSPFILNNYSKELLFFTMNHPSNRMLGFLAEEILRSIGVEGGIDYQRIASRRWRRTPREILGQTFYPLHANHARALKLEFGRGVVAGSSPYRIGGRTLTPLEAVQAFFDYYESNPRVVESNL
jgi:Polysaccharide biosynthesis enzyme WcbI